MGGNPDGRKVGLVDPHQIWAFMAVPCNHSWRSNFYIEGSFPVHVRNMIEHYVPLDGDGSVITRQAVKKVFLASLLSVLCCIFVLLFGHLFSTSLFMPSFSASSGLLEPAR